MMEYSFYSSFSVKRYNLDKYLQDSSQFRQLKYIMIFFIFTPICQKLQSAVDRVSLCKILPSNIRDERNLIYILI